MNIKRRELPKMFALLLVFAAVPFALVGCVDIPTLINYISLTVGIILTVATPFLPPGASVIAGLVKAGLADLSATITEYNADTNPADKATLLAKIDTILTDAIANFQQLIATILPGAGAFVTLIENLAEDVLSAIAGIRSQFANPPAVITALEIKATKKSITPRKYKKPTDYRDVVNRHLVAAGRPELALH